MNPCAVSGLNSGVTRINSSDPHFIVKLSVVSMIIRCINYRTKVHARAPSVVIASAIAFIVLLLLIGSRIRFSWKTLT